MVENLCRVSKLLTNLLPAMLLLKCHSATMSDRQQWRTGDADDVLYYVSVLESCQSPGRSPQAARLQRFANNVSFGGGASSRPAWVDCRASLLELVFSLPTRAARAKHHSATSMPQVNGTAHTCTSSNSALWCYLQAAGCQQICWEGLVAIRYA